MPGTARLRRQHARNTIVKQSQRQAGQDPGPVGVAPALGLFWEFAKIPIFPGGRSYQENIAKKLQDKVDAGDGASFSTQASTLVHEVIRSPGQVLAPAIRAPLEARFGLDFSLVRIHTDERASESARALHARAYTVGQHIAFASGEFAPATAKGFQLISHELAHTVQQRSSPGSEGSNLEVGSARDFYEAEADHAASASAERSRVRVAELGKTPRRVQRAPPDDTVDVDVEQTPEPSGVKLPQVSGATLAGAGGTPYASVLPGYSQSGDTCGAASLVSALIIWDREHWKPTEPNSRVVTACNLTLIEFVRRGTAAVQGWAMHPTAEARRIAAAVPGTTVTDVYDTIRLKLVQDLSNIRDSARQPGATVTEGDYQTIGVALYFLWNLGGSGGLSSASIGSLQGALGLSQNKPSAATNIQSFDDLFSNSIVTGLMPDQIAQAGWFVKTGRQHAFLIGRLQSGEWFLSDQGPQPAAEFRAPSLVTLQSAVAAAARSGAYWLYVGTIADYLAAGGVLPGWLGVKLLAPASGVESKAEELIGSGAFLGEVDAGILTTGDRITRVSFISRAYSLSDAKTGFPATNPGGGVIVEAPIGVFNLYSTSAVSQSNISETSLDAEDSKDGVLVRNRTIFSHAWLILGTSGGGHGNWFSVY